MSSCRVSNSSEISCDYGCCGTTENRMCCDFKLSESVIIVICVVGALVVVAIVVALIICLTSKQKNRVTHIRPRQRRNMLNVIEPRARRVEIPKPPPYSEAPPRYDSFIVSDDSRSNPRSTDPILPGHRTTNNRRARRQHGSRRRNQTTEQRHLDSTEQTDAPPPYISIINIASNEDGNQRNYSPEPGTSGMGNITAGRLSNNDISSMSVMERAHQSSPHPSLASGRISTSMYKRPSENRSLHRTVSERSRHGSPHPGFGRRHLVHGNGSVSPVTIREITVHSHIISNQNSGHDNNSGTGNKTKRSNIPTKIPRPVKQKNTTTSNISAGLLPGAIEESNSLSLGESPPPLNSTAAARSAQRHLVLQKLQQRKVYKASPHVQ